MASTDADSSIAVRSANPEQASSASGGLATHWETGNSAGNVENTIMTAHNNEPENAGNTLTKSETSRDMTTFPTGPVRTDTTTALAQANAPPSPPPALPKVTGQTLHATAIGPSSEQADPTHKETDGATSSGPFLQLTLLLTSGARHPFRLDANYLTRRNIEAKDQDVYNMTVYQLKESILREWREEWEQKPSNASFIRLISFGRLLDDKGILKDQRFNSQESNVLHMTIKPQEFAEDDYTKYGKALHEDSTRSPHQRSPGCRCVVM